MTSRPQGTPHTERVYALHRCADSRWLLLNRRYKPYGQGLDHWVDYESCSGIRLRLTYEQVARLDGGAAPYRPGDPVVYLYSDATRPERGGPHLRAYCDRISTLLLDTWAVCS